MTISLKTRKQEMVREAIFDAAMELFVLNGFNETTVHQVVEAAGISQRSFFRYFATKSDLLAYRISGLGDALVSAVAACPPEMPALEVVREAASAGIEYSRSEPRTLQIIEISAQNPAARQAHRAAMVEVESRLSEAFAVRVKSASKYNLEPRMLSLLTLMADDLAWSSWFAGETKDSSTALRNAFRRLTCLFRESGAASPVGLRKRPVRQLAKR